MITITKYRRYNAAEIFCRLNDTQITIIIQEMLSRTSTGKNVFTFYLKSFKLLQLRPPSTIVVRCLPCVPPDISLSLPGHRNRPISAQEVKTLQKLLCLIEHL